MRALSELDQLEGDYADLLTKTLRSRLLTLLVSLQRQASARRNSDRSSFELPLPRREPAALLGATPESVSRMISRLNAEGAVRIAERRVELHA
ncbi:MAG: helix-turn-helix domain-containing protein, partial [Pseudomonadota bacterium]